MLLSDQNDQRTQKARGTIYVTNQRVCCYESLSNYVYMNLPLSEVSEYDTKRVLFATFVYVYDRSNKSHVFSIFPAKKL